MSEPFERRRTEMRRYRSESRRRRSRHMGRWLVVALLVVAAAAAAVFVWGMAGGEPEQTAARPASSPDVAPVTTALEDVETAAGQRVTLPYRVSMQGAESVLVTLVVTRPDGTPVRHLLRDAERPANADLSWAGTLSLKPGSYRYVAYATVDGRPQRVAVPARLTVTAPAFPSDKAVAAAIAWIKGRSGSPGLAVVSSDGELHGVRLDTQYQSYSLSKAMMLVAYLRAHTTVGDTMRATMTRMIENSDNSAADVMYREVGGAAGLTRLARTVGMKRFTAGAGWISTRVTPADQARFFYDMETYIPQRHRAFARQLLSSITSRQRWGIVAAAGPLGWKVYFKGGWSGGNVVMTQAARLQRDGRTWAVAVMTTGNPDWTYGFGTLKGVTGVLLGRQPTGAYLTQVLE